MSLVEIVSVSRSYGRVQALEDVNLVLQPGTIGLVGNNGAGKSTLLKLLLGLLTSDQGTCRVLGLDSATAGRGLRGQIGYMPEAAAIVPVLTGVEFVSLAGDLYGMGHRDARRRAHEVLGYVGLGELRYRRLEEYSQGNLQRLKLAAALVHDPKLLLLDEPTGGLDPKGRLGMLRLLQDLIRETDKSVILCTHLLGDVERICEHVVFLHRGRVLRSEAVANLRARETERYWLSWQGEDESWRQKLRDEGCRILEDGQPGRALVAIPPASSTRDLFRMAQEAGILLTELKPDEEDLQRVFLRLTDEPSPPEPQDAAHGN